MLPVAAYGRSAGPPVGHTGAAVDGGQSCTQCHRTFALNSGAGKVSISTVSYTPGTKQNITVTVEDPDARRWGFQLTARLRSDDSKQAGTFTVTGNVRVRCLPDDRDAPCNATANSPATPAAPRGPVRQGRASGPWNGRHRPPTSAR